MRASRMNLVTLREDPSDAEIASHRLLMRAGFLHKSGAGLYLYAPLLQRVLDKASRIVSEEISRTGGLEVTMPIMQERALWEKSGRWATYQASRTMLTVKDRGDQEFGLAPTAEEVVTDYAGTVVKSYKQLPVTFFQQHTKFRDEIRPRFGLMRVKEFIMMDAYSFHAEDASLDVTYEAMRVAYLRTFKRLGLEAFAVEADSGAIGGSGSHEFMVAADVGEDAIIYCSACGYAANVERAESKVSGIPPWNAPQVTIQNIQPTLTPGAKSIEEVVAFLNRSGHPDIRPEHLVKTVLFVAKMPNGNQTVAACVRGDREVNQVKLTNAVTRFLGRVGGGQVLELRPMNPDEIREATGAEPGFAGPGPGLKVKLCIIDKTLDGNPRVVVGANRTDHHYVGWPLMPVSGTAPILSSPIEHDAIYATRSGDSCPRCAARLEQKRGIEVGHIFKLGTKYSVAMKSEFTGQDGKLHPFVMGCYGIGTSRVIAAAVEQHNDADGIRWPMAIAPYHCVVVPIGKPGDAAVEGAAQSIYDELIKQGLEAVLDDRDQKPGVKFKDWDLVGIPLRIVCGRGVAEGVVEFKPRGGEVANIPLADAASVVVTRVREALAASAAAADAVR